MFDYSDDIPSSAGKGYEVLSILEKEELPKWQRIKYDIELKIIAGEYETGDKVPSVRSLAKLYNIGTSTSQVILERMYLDGTLVIEQGIGFKVAQQAQERLREEHERRIKENLEKICKEADKIKIDPVKIVKGFYTKK